MIFWSLTPFFKWWVWQLKWFAIFHYTPSSMLLILIFTHCSPLTTIVGNVAYRVVTRLMLVGRPEYWLLPWLPPPTWFHILIFLWSRLFHQSSLPLSRGQAYDLQNFQIVFFPSKLSAIMFFDHFWPMSPSPMFSTRLTQLTSVLTLFIPRK